MDHWYQRSAIELVHLLRAREVSSEEITMACLQRIAEVNPSLHAFVQVFERSAMRQARKLDKRLKRSDAGDLPLFAGVPTGIKDIDFVRFSFTQFGSRYARFLWSPVDNAVTRLFREAGFVLVGKLATSELAIMPITETDIHPPCRNPWNPEHTPGGSSGGSASAVAAGLLPIAHASDGAGSIRIPAAFCHLYGLKPSRGLMPNFYKAYDPFGLSTVNSVSHDVADSAMLLDALVHRRYSPASPSEDSFLAKSRQAPKSLQIRFCVNAPVGEVAPEMQEAVRHVAGILEGLGHHVEASEMETGSIDEFLPTWSRQAANLPVWLDSMLQPPLRWLRQEGRKYSKKEAWAQAEVLEKRVLAWFGDVDIWLTPTVSQTSPPVGYWRDMGGKEAFDSVIPMGVFTAIFNISGQPAANIPYGLSKEGLPFGVQVVAQRGRDDLVLAVSQQLEDALSWTDRRSPFYRSSSARAVK